MASTDPISGASSTSTTATGTTAASSTTALSNDLNDFLKLLTTQLQNQDPTQPMDTNQFTQQIATLSQVQQQINTNANLEKMTSLYTATQVNSTVGYIGKQVEATGSQVALANGATPVVYNLSAPAASATVNITDANGTVVFSGAGTTTSGRNEVFWNGTNSITGAKMPDGVYNVSISAKDAAGNDLKPTTSTSGIVTAVTVSNGTPTLQMGDIAVPIANITRIGDNPYSSAQTQTSTQPQS